jgi:hypothetical protein
MDAEEILEEARRNTARYAAAASQSEYFNTLQENQCHELCSSGTCKADCCGCVSFLEGHFKTLKKFIPDGAEYHLTKIKENGYAYVKPVTPNFKCVFLNKDHSCAIYNSHLRPDYCKRFGEDKSEPLYACTYINQEMKAEIEAFAKLYLAQQAGAGNPVAQHMMKQIDPKSDS